MVADRCRHVFTFCLRVRCRLQDADKLRDRCRLQTEGQVLLIDCEQTEFHSCFGR